MRPGIFDTIAKLLLVKMAAFAIAALISVCAETEMFADGSVRDSRHVCWSVTAVLSQVLASSGQWAVAELREAADMMTWSAASWMRRRHVFGVKAFSGKMEDFRDVSSIRATCNKDDEPQLSWYHEWD